MARLDDAASMSGQGTATGRAEAPVQEIEANGIAKPHAARVALSHITIGDLIIFLFKLAIAALVVAIPFAILVVIISSLK